MIGPVCPGWVCPLAHSYCACFGGMCEDDRLSEGLRVGDRVTKSFTVTLIGQVHTRKLGNEWDRRVYGQYGLYKVHVHRSAGKGIENYTCHRIARMSFINPGHKPSEYFLQSHTKQSTATPQPYRQSPAAGVADPVLGAVRHDGRCETVQDRYVQCCVPVLVQRVDVRADAGQAHCAAQWNSERPVGGYTPVVPTTYNAGESTAVCRWAIGSCEVTCGERESGADGDGDLGGDLTVEGNRLFL